MWKLPDNVVTRLREVLTGAELPMRLEGPGNAGLFAYDNGAFELENFAPIPQRWRIAVPQGRELRGLGGGEARGAAPAGSSASGEALYDVRLSPSRYAAFEVRLQRE